MKEISRRDLILKPFVVLDKFRSKPDSSANLKSVDNFTETACELTVLALAIHAAVEGGKDKLMTVTVSPKETISSIPAMQEAYVGSVSWIAEQTGLNLSSMSGLSTEWSNAYYKSRLVTNIVMTTSCTGEGSSHICTSSPTLVTTTEHYWDEPQELVAAGLNSGTINDWYGKINDLNSKLNSVLSLLPDAPAFRDGVNSVQLNEQAIDLGSRTVALGLGFGTSAALFAFYEEIVEKIAKSNDLDSEFLTTLSDRKIKRRSLLKLGLGAVAISKIQDLQRSIVNNNSGLLTEVTSEVHDFIGKKMDSTDSEMFENWFGESVDEVMNTIEQVQRITTNTLQAGKETTESWGKIEPQLQGLLENVTYLKRVCTQQFGYEGAGKYTISPEFFSAIKKVWAYENIKNIVSAKSVEVNSSAVSQIITFAALLLGISVGSEVITEATDNALNHFTS